MNHPRWWWPSWWKRRALEQKQTRDLLNIEAHIALGEHHIHQGIKELEEGLKILNHAKAQVARFKMDLT